MSANAYQQVHITTFSPKSAPTFWRPDGKLIRGRTLRETGVATDATVREENVRLEERTRIAQNSTISPARLSRTWRFASFFVPLPQWFAA